MADMAPQRETQAPLTRMRPILERLMVMWVRSCSSLYRKLSTNVTREMCRYLPVVGSLLRFTQTDVSIFKFEDASWSFPIPFNQPITWDAYSRYALIGTSRVLCCGGCNMYEHANRAYLLLLNSDPIKVEELPRLRQARHTAGVAGHDEDVFVFGGIGEANSEGSSQLRSGETLRLLNEQWEPLCTMSEGRSNFTPCQHELSIYLAGGYATSIEVFRVDTWSLLVLRTLLPEMSSCLAWLSEKTLFVLSFNFVTRLRLDSGEVQQERHNFLSLNAKACPLACGDFVCWSGWDDKCYRLRSFCSA